MSEITRDRFAQAINRFGYLSVNDFVKRDVGYVYDGLSLDYTSETTYHHPFIVVGESSREEYLADMGLTGAKFFDWPFYYRVSTD